MAAAVNVGAPHNGVAIQRAEETSASDAAFAITTGVILGGGISYALFKDSTAGLVGAAIGATVAIKLLNKHTNSPRFLRNTETAIDLSIACAGITAIAMATLGVCTMVYIFVARDHGVHHSGPMRR